ncbi:Metalloprotease [Chlamydiales bacterium STE3]|nr:Metalloprotease [Chlamydiales bacterium STE3]
MFLHVIPIWMIPLTFLFAQLTGEDTLQSEIFLENIQTTQLVLKNGMHVFLRPSKNEEEEVMVQLAAKGGYTSCPVQEQFAARIISDVIAGSGIGSLSSDQLSALLYHYCIELDVSIKPFYRMISAECDSDSLPMLVKLLHDFFLEPKFNKTGLENTVFALSEVIDNSCLDKTKKFENAFFCLNTQTGPKKIPLSKEGLRAIEVCQLPAVFEKVFANPKDFCCVITGSFDKKLIKPYVVKLLGEIPNKTDPLGLNILASPAFPVKPCTQTLSLKNSFDSLTRITFPITIPIDCTNFFKLEMVCQTIESHLKTAMKKRFKSSYGINVAHEFPFYPSFTLPWITVQYRCSYDQAEDLAKIIVAEVHYLKNKGPTLNDLRLAEKSQKANDDFWHKEDEYWVSFITNAFLMNLNPESTFVNQKESRKMSLEKMKMNLATFFDATRHTRLTTKPE